MKVTLKVTLYVVGALAALFATAASAQPINLTGKYQCVQNCRYGALGGRAFVTQNGWDINVLNEAGESTRAWFDWFSPTRIWFENWNTGAVYSPDGMTIQFDRGTLWQRDLDLPPPPPPRRRR